MFISQVRLERFKRLNDCTVRLGPATVIVGGNNSGKTSVLQGVHFALCAVNHTRNEEPVAGSENTFRLQPGDLPYSPQADASGAAHGGALGANSSRAIKITIHSPRDESLSVEISKGRGTNLRIRLDGNNFVTNDSGSPDAPADDSEPDSLRSIYVPGISGVPTSEEFRSLGSCKKIIARGDSNLALRSVLWHLCEDETSWKRFCEDLATVFPDVEITPKFDPLNDDRVKVFYDTADDRQLPLDSAGVGLVKTLQILAYRHLFKPDILLLDEPDAHLSPDRQRALCGLIESLASDGTQVALSTHSRHMLDELRHRADVVWLRNGDVVDGDDQLRDMLLDLGALDSTEHFTNKSLRCIVATEDSKRVPVTVLLESSGFNMKETLVLPYHGCKNFNAVRMLGEFLRDTAPAVRLVVHQDRDYQTSDEVSRFTALCNKERIECFVTTPTSVEGYFLSPEHLCEHNPVDVETASRCIYEATRTCEGADVKRVASSLLEQDGGGSGGESKSLATYREDPVRWRHAKSVLGITKSLIQKAQRRNVVVFRSSEHVADVTLQSIATKLWG